VLHASHLPPRNIHTPPSSHHQPIPPISHPLYPLALASNTDKSNWRLYNQPPSLARFLSRISIPLLLTIPIPWTQLTAKMPRCMSTTEVLKQQAPVYRDHRLVVTQSTPFVSLSTHSSPTLSHQVSKIHHSLHLPGDLSFPYKNTQFSYTYRHQPQ
jgi:hypothetical protein